LSPACVEKHEKIKCSTYAHLPTSNKKLAWEVCKKINVSRTSRSWLKNFRNYLRLSIIVIVFNILYYTQTVFHFSLFFLIWIALNEIMVGIMNAACKEKKKKLQSIYKCIRISKHCIYSSVLSSLHTKDLPWYAPQNQILLLPWIWSSSSEAFVAATDGTGWPVDHLTKVWSGAWSGLSVTRKGRPVSSIFCRKIQYLNNRIR